MKKVLFFLICALMCINYSCKQNATTAENPFFSEWTTEFGVPPFDKIEDEHYKPAFEEAMRQHNQEIDSIVMNPEAPTFENTIEALDRSGELLNKVAGVFFMVAAADLTPQMQIVQEEIAPALSAHEDNISFNDKLFERVEAVYAQRNELNLDEQQMRLLEKTRRSFVRSGSLLDSDKKARLKELNQQLTLASVQFGNNMLADNKSFELVIDNEEDLKGLPQNVISAAAATAEQLGHAGKWVFRLNKPSLIPFITYADNRDLREKLYKGYLERCNHNDSTDNKSVVNDIVRLRTERAHILGYKSHADYVLDVNMAKNPKNVYAMLEGLWPAALDRAKKELDEMKRLKKIHTNDEEFASWDWWYYAERLRKQKYSLDEEMLRPFFSLGNVRSGIFELSNRLYGITFRPVSLPVYNEECETYEVLDKDGSHLAVLYLDFHPRDSKGAGAWCGTFREQSYDKDGNRISPVVSIVCNFTRPTGNTPALLTIDETCTFFHEFGHAIHNFFSDVRYVGISNVERDFVELPSQIMENWAMEPEMLKSYALHYATGMPISDEIIAKIQNSAMFNQGFTTTELVAASLIDMDIHSLTEYKPLDVNAFERKMLTEKRGLISQIEPRYHYTYFSHIFDGGYAAGYYGYMWAEVLDKDAFAAFKESGDLFNQKIAKSFRDNILSRGGIDDGVTMYRKFRGQDASIEHLKSARGL